MRESVDAYAVLEPGAAALTTSCADQASWRCHRAEVPGSRAFLLHTLPGGVRSFDERRVSTMVLAGLDQEPENLPDRGQAAEPTIYDAPGI